MAGAVILAGFLITILRCYTSFLILKDKVVLVVYEFEGGELNIRLDNKISLRLHYILE